MPPPDQQRAAGAGSPIGVHIGPRPSGAVADAIRAAGGRVTELADADAVVWLEARPDSLPPLPERVRWVQLPGAGVDRWLPRIAEASGPTFTSGAGVYSRPVAEHALTLLLASVRRIAESARARHWVQDPVPALQGSTVAVVGAGGIGGALIDLLVPHGVTVVAVTRTGREVAGAARHLPASRLGEVWASTDHVVLAAPATDATRHMVGAAELAAMRPHGCLVNVARGALVDTDALALALRTGAIGGAALDVTDPEPLPDGHPLWCEPRALITPHIGTPPAGLSPHFAARVADNARRFAAGEPLLAVVDLARGY